MVSRRTTLFLKTTAFLKNSELPKTWTLLLSQWWWRSSREEWLAWNIDKIAKLGPLLGMFLGDGKSEAALVGFDSKPRLVRDFTRSTDDLTDDLQHFETGDGGAAILDTIGYAVDLLQTQPKGYRRVLLLISEQRDHGSRHVKPEKLVERIGLTDVLVLSLTFSPSKAEFLHDVKDNGDNRVMDPDQHACVMAVRR